jgi:gamma-glutamyltranspeptidase / glutathione hydrolase
MRSDWRGGLVPVAFRFCARHRTARILMKIVFSRFILLLCFAPSLLAQQPARPVEAKHGMVVSAHALASEAGVEVMKAGGNAIDAAIATGLALAVVQPGAGNIGGGGFMVIVMKDGRSFAFDFREKAPGAARKEMYLDASGKYVKNSNHEGYRAVGVPGTVAGFDLALRKLGTKSWKELTVSAIRLAEGGFTLSPSMDADFKNMKRDFEKYSSTAKIFLKNNGLPYTKGDLWRQPDLAKSLKLIQKYGRDGFYKGTTAHLIAEDMKMHGGLITEEDLAEYQAVERAPIHGTYRGYDIISMPPPSSGGVALIEMLNILEGYDLKSAGHNTAASLHLLAEAMRNAYRDRAEYLGDPDFVASIPVEKLTSKENAKKIRESINLQHASKSTLGKHVGASESSETTHYSVVDSEGNAVVVTYTLEQWYGSRIVAEGTGIMLNDEMGDFNPIPGVTDSTGFIGTKPNLVEPGKRMLSSMTPTIILQNGKPWVLLGAVGGRTIINSVLQGVLNLVDYQMNIVEAIEAGRIHHQWLPDHIVMERSVSTGDLRMKLEAMGHRIERTFRLGPMNGLMIDPKTGVREGAADSRDPNARAVGY